MTSTGRRGYVGVDRRWLADKALSDSALRLMLWLESHTHEYLRDLNKQRVAKEIGWSRERVNRTISDLEELGLVSTEQIDRPLGGTRTEITLDLDEWSRTGASRRDTAVSHDETRAVSHDETRTTSTLSVVGTHSQEPPNPPLFFEFWERYPRKVGRAAAIKAWCKLTPDAWAKALEVIDLHTQMWAAEGRGLDTIPHASTWLNGERWEDEVAFVAPRNTNTKAARSKAAIQRATIHEPKALWS